MFCNKCGRLIEENTKFCGGCGTAIPVQNNVQQNTNVTPNVQTSNIPQENNNPNLNNESFVNSGANANNAQAYQNYDKIINPSMKKYAIFSVVIPAISIFVYWNIGLTSYIAILLAILGFNFAKKGRMHSKTLSTIGYILNSILVAMAIFMYIMIALEQL